MKIINEEKVNSYISSLNVPPKKEEEKTITEGIKYFKASKRLFKLAEKITQRAKQRNSQHLVELAAKINALGEKFEFVEDNYDVGNKTEAVKQYNALKKQYSEILKLLQKEEIKNGLKKIGSISLTIAAMTIPYLAMSKFFPNLVSIKSEEGSSFSQNTEHYLKRAGAFTLCGLPVRFVKGAFNTGLEVYDDKIINSVDRLLNA